LAAQGRLEACNILAKCAWLDLETVVSPVDVELAVRVHLVASTAGHGWSRVASD
jgi:hypothetical protein